MVWRSLKSKVRNGQETSVLVWFTFLSMIFFLIISNAVSCWFFPVRPEPGGSKKAPRYPEEPLSGVAFHLQLELNSSVSERVEVR